MDTNKRHFVSCILSIGLAVTINVATLSYLFLQQTTQPEPWSIPEMELQEMGEPSEVAYGARSSQWSTIRKHYLESHPECEACGTREDLNVHHVKPYHTNPELELDISNLITLCRKHHLEIGHRGNWKDANPYVREDAVRMRKKYHP